ncbi:hypothetical protein K1719_024977 [Acacia pycnantha]|nr:hypothetical protein K1719_024977 [Acacia pycnantha]
MASPNGPLSKHSEPLEKIFDLSDGKLTRVIALSPKGGFLGFFQEEPSDRLMNSLGRFTGRDFLSIFRFKTWWSTQWVGNSGSDLQMETQWVLFDLPEIKSYVIIIPIIIGSFRSALHPGSDGHVMICAESGSTQVKASSFNAIAYIHVLLEEKTLPNLIGKFGWCTWDAFYLTVDPVRVWHGLKDFAKGGMAPRFLIIDDGWQSINFDGDKPNEDAKNLTVGGKQMTARICRLEEGDKFKKYQAGLMLGSNAPPFDPKKTEKLLAKGVELQRLESRVEAIQHESATLSNTELMRMKQLKQDIDDLFGEGPRRVWNKECGGSCCKTEDSVMKAFTRDLRTEFKGLDDIYVWHAICGAWGGVRPGATHLNSKIVPCKLSPGLDGTMHDLAVVNIVKGSIGLVHSHQAHDIYDSMHSYLAKCGITGVKVDVIHTLEYVCEEYGGRVSVAKAYYSGLINSIVKNFNGCGIIASIMQQCNDFFFLGTKQIAMGRAGDDFWVSDPTDPMGSFSLQVVFNCQGAGWDLEAQRIRGFPECYKLGSGSVHVSEVEWDQKKETGDMGEAKEYAVYQSEARKLILMSRQSERIPVILRPSTFELFSFAPVHKLRVGAKFAPFGLINMLNNGGSIKEVEVLPRLRLKEEATSSEIPKKCQLNGISVLSFYF